MPWLRKPFPYHYLNLTLGVILANAVIFFLMFIKSGALPLLALDPVLILDHGFWWQFLTFSYVHVGFFHVLFNLMALFFFAFPVEHRMGSWDFILYYHLSSWIPGLLVFGGAVYGLWDPGIFFGADASIYAVLLAFATFGPHEVIYLFGLVPLRAPVLVLIYLVVLGTLEFFSGGFTALILLLGFVIGIIYLAIRFRLNAVRVFWDSFRR